LFIVAPIDIAPTGSIDLTEMRDRQRHHIDCEIVNQSTTAANAISGTLIQSTSHIAS
jgi:hypothetical protein